MSASLRATVPSLAGTRSLHHHVAALRRALVHLDGAAADVDRWAQHLAPVLSDGGRLLVAGTGGSAAQAQHLTGELVGRFRDERRPLSALALHTETSSLTAITDDYGAEQAFARQVQAHGRAGDVLLVLSPSGRSPNLVAALGAAGRGGLLGLALTGRGPNAVAEAADDAISVPGPTTATVQELHQVVLHLLCLAIEAHLPEPLTLWSDGTATGGSLP